MSIYSLRNRVIILIALIIFGQSAFLSAQDILTDKLNSSLDTPNIKKEAESYRQQGYEYQKMGNLEGAMTFYQKATQLDPGYALAYNDLGIIYEANGCPECAEQVYQKAIELDPKLLSAYSNLALLYESQDNLGRASFYWSKRVELGNPQDPWTIRARQRMEDINAVGAIVPFSLREQEVKELLGEINQKKLLAKSSNREFALQKFAQAKAIYQKGDEVLALKIAVDAMYLDPDNWDIRDFVDQLRIRVLSR
jgi:Flp pilus assembly protein TadD